MVPRALSSLVLASGSPQRRAILEQLRLDFRVVVSDVDELSEGDPEAVALENATRKARAVAGREGDDVPVLGVDTLVALDGAIFGKPRDAEDALRTLRSLQGCAHQVWSGVVVAHDGALRSETVRTDVVFAPCGDAQLRGYVETGEWQGRAGGYAIQESGAWLVERIDGDYSNVVGLPVSALRRLLPEAAAP